MPLLSINSFFSYMPENKGRILGCDVGTKTIGLALSDTHHTIATPLQVIHRKKWSEDAKLLLSIIHENQVKALIIGFPLNMNGSEGPRCQAIRQFALNVIKLHDLPLCLWDERLSTVAVTRTLLEADVSRQKRKKVVDKMAAAYILQGFLDALNTQQRN